MLRDYGEIKHTCSCRYNGKTELRRTVPDSITSWVLTAFSVNDAHGLGLIEEPRKVVAFIHMHLYTESPEILLRKINFLGGVNLII